ncbi:MAG: preprotein translocase subunit YajC [Dehalococcoidia bacterium]|nr:preprotein translocase subunit YajC [Dehalococcoidia bacterium]
MFAIVILVAMFAIFYFLLIRPQQKRQKEHVALIASLQKGDKVIAAGGVYGQIESVSEEDVILKVEDGGKLRVLKASVMLKQETE